MFPSERTEISSGSLVVSEMVSAARPQKTGTVGSVTDLDKRKKLVTCAVFVSFPICAGMRRKRGTQLSPFKVPDSNSIFRLSVNEREDRKEVSVRA